MTSAARSATRPRSRSSMPAFEPRRGPGPRRVRRRIDEDGAAPRCRSPAPPATRAAPRHPRRGQGPDRRRRGATALGRARAEWPSATPRSSPGCGRQARSSSARRARTSSASARSRPARGPARRGPQPGGSSGGSAIAVATGAALLALATDTAAARGYPPPACGVAGSAPHAMDAHDGVSILAPSFDRLGLIAATPRTSPSPGPPRRHDRRRRRSE